jgi:nucleotide-binding universal stress UspA family protein
MTDSGSDRWTKPGVILVATDLSELDRLMPFALEQASHSHSRLILLHALAVSAAMPLGSPEMSHYDPWSGLELAEKALKPWCESARRFGVACDALVREGHPTDQIIATARQFQADRILLGTRSRSKLGKVLIGSVAEQVLRAVNLPVMTVGPEAYLPAQGSYERRVVLHATTLRETSLKSAALAGRFAAEWKAKLVLLHVLPPLDEMQRKGQPTGFDSAAMQELRAMAAMIGAESGGEVEPVVIHGNPSIEILAQSVEQKASVIVLGATHRSALENLTRDRTVYRVLAHARCPVLTLREGQTVQQDSAHQHAGAYFG